MKSAKRSDWEEWWESAAADYTFIDREEGVSKMSGGIIHEAILGVLKLKWDSFFK